MKRCEPADTLLAAETTLILSTCHDKYRSIKRFVSGPARGKASSECPPSVLVLTLDVCDVVNGQCILS